VLIREKRILLADGALGTATFEQILSKNIYLQSSSIRRAMQKFKL